MTCRFLLSHCFRGQALFVFFGMLPLFRILVALARCVIVYGRIGPGGHISSIPILFVSLEGDICMRLLPIYVNSPYLPTMQALTNHMLVCVFSPILTLPTNPLVLARQCLGYISRLQKRGKKTVEQGDTLIFHARNQTIRF